MAKRKKKRVKRFAKRRPTRNFDDPAYKKWRNKVLTRDGRRCQWPKCNSKIKLQCHHLKKWSDYPHLRFDVGNGITLCRRHHDFIRHKEEQYEPMFRSILIGKLLRRLKELNDDEE